MVKHIPGIQKHWAILIRCKRKYLIFDTFLFSIIFFSFRESYLQFILRKTFEDHHLLKMDYSGENPWMDLDDEAEGKQVKYFKLSFKFSSVELL